MIPSLRRLKNRASFRSNFTSNVEKAEAVKSPIAFEKKWNFSSVKVSDDLVAMTDDAESSKRERTNSSLHIKLVLKTE